MRQMQNDALKLILMQSAVILSTSVLFLLISWEMAYSVLLGGLVCLLPNLYFTYKLFIHSSMYLARQIVYTFYVSEIIKLVMIAALSVIVFRFIAISAPTFFFGFILAQLTFLVAPTAIFWRRAKAVRSCAS